MSEIAWAAGLFEGEGSAHIAHGRVRLQLKMTEHSSVERFAAAVAPLGKLYGPYGNQSAERRDGYPRKPFLMWVAVRDDADAALALLTPFLSAWRSEVPHAAR